MIEEKNNFNILFAGGDMRQIYAAQCLEERGFKVSFFALGEKNCAKEKHYDIIVLPAPCTRDGETLFAPLCEKKIFIENLAEFAPPKAVIAGGCGSIENKIFSGCETKFFDILKDDEYNTLNAAASAEGAICCAIKAADFNLLGSEILITGFGKIGKVLSSDLRGLGARVSVAARKASDLALAEALGFEPVKYSALSDFADKFKIIFNTVPKTVIDEDIIKNLNKSCIIIDLASKPGGVDFSAAEKHNIKTLWELGLPGRYSPKTSGEIIAKIIKKITDGII